MLKTGNGRRVRRDLENQVWRDLLLLDFRREVLDKYRNHEFCKIGGIIFRSCKKIRKHRSNKNIIMVQAKNFIYVTPKEGKHWQLYQVNK